jgi:hypothetical protein
MNKIEQEILEKAKTAFENATKAEMEYVFTNIDYDPPLPPKMKRVDAVLKIRIVDYMLKYWIHVKAAITPTILEIIINQGYANKNQKRHKWLLVARYIAPQYAKALKKWDIPFIDTAGNAYINEPSIYIDIQGKKPEEMNWLKLTEKGTIAQAGLRAVYTLLIKNELVNAPYREIANAAGVALGTIDRVFKDLRRRKLIVDINNGKKMLTNKRELIEWWVDAYIEKLRPKLLIGRYETDDYEQFQNVDFEKLNARWGGEKAAEIITHYLKPEIFTIYAKRPINELIMQLKLRVRPTGRIEIREQFWNFVDTQRSNLIVHPILVYADLLATGEARNIETAKLIYEAIIAMEN